ncbi:lymphocyte antigen 6H-like [Acropora millepora]|uniref:lymphocyte antigen 6H-like n=1 Tax=Acropora millepora TaxID=45264 RepID=UPI001CF4D8AE|nr:lymphocyte antigen 6H-like [Acropora millepora]
MKFLHIFAFLLWVSVADGLKCYKCVSTSSWGDCNQKEVTCDSGFNTCAKVYAQVKRDDVSITEYAKGCATQESCDAAESSLCKGKISGGKCDINCCSTDLCNTAAIQVINVIFLVLCAFLASVLMQ